MNFVIFGRQAWPPQAPGLAQRWTTGILSTRGVLSSASVAAPAPQAPGPRLPARHSEVQNAAIGIVKHSLESAVLGHCIAFPGVSKERGAVFVQLKRASVAAPGPRAGPEVDHRNPLHKGGFKLRQRGRPSPPGPGPQAARCPGPGQGGVPFDRFLA
eukprot:gene9459-biopygen22727